MEEAEGRVGQDGGSEGVGGARSRTPLPHPRGRWLHGAREACKARCRVGETENCIKTYLQKLPPERCGRSGALSGRDVRDLASGFLVYALHNTGDDFAGA